MKTQAQHQIKLQGDQESKDHIQVLRQWLKQNGCLIHKSLEIPSYINGYQGVSSKHFLPHKTLLMAIPHSLILTVSKCYKAPQLKKLFQNNDDLFDYEQTDDAQFNVLCVFLMFHKQNLNKSQWSPYLNTIAAPQTAVDWVDSELNCLNNSLIQQILHIRKECKQLQDKLVKYILQFADKPKKPFYNVSEIRLRAVMTRCFGSYYGQACMIPAVDLINHGCEAINHQLMYLPWETKEELQNKQPQIINREESNSQCQQSEQNSSVPSLHRQNYKIRHQQFDCSIFPELKLPKPQKQLTYPFRLAFIQQNKIVTNKNIEQMPLSRKQMDTVINKFNQKRLIQDKMQITHLNFCEENCEQDNDTDQQVQTELKDNFDKLKEQEIEMIKQWWGKKLKIQKYIDVDKKINKPDQKKEEVEEKIKKTQKTQLKIVDQKTQLKIVDQKTQLKIEDQKTQLKIEDQKTQLKIEDQKTQLKIEDQKPINNIQNQSYNQTIKTQIQTKPQQSTKQQNIERQINQDFLKKQSIFQQMQSSQSDSQAEPWCQLQGSYFTVSSDLPIKPNTQIYNSYGSRTNKFLLVWYGFAYRDNLYDSVSLRLHVQFPNSIDPPPAKQTILDTYFGSHGLRSFRKNYANELVHDHELSKQFRLKRSKLCLTLIRFLRLYLLNYYKGAQMVKIIITLPSSLDFQIYVLKYYLDILQELYNRYPLQNIEYLYKQKQQYQVNVKTNTTLGQQQKKDLNQKVSRINFKIIYLEEQRKIIDVNLKATKIAIQILIKLKVNKAKKLQRQSYIEYPIEMLRILQQYLVQINSNYNYIDYFFQEQNQDNEQDYESVTDSEEQNNKE